MSPIGTLIKVYAKIMPINVKHIDKALHGYSRETQLLIILTQVSVNVQYVTTSSQIPICSPQILI
jgi:hypothetical protein